MANLTKKFRVSLTPEARAELEAIVRQTSAGVGKVRRAKILLMADDAHPEGGYADWEIAEEVGLCERQVVRIRQKFVKSGVRPTVTRATRSDAGVCRTIDGRAEAQLVTMACSAPPEGRDAWTLQLLCDELRRLKIVRSVCRETVRQMLKKTNCSPGSRNASASRRRIGRGLSRGWKKCSTSIKRRSTSSVR
jgi:Homeodomain-like domain